MSLSASISLRSEASVAFGTARRIELEDLVVETPGNFPLGGTLEFQLELPGLSQTVYGSAVVRKAAVRNDDVNRFALRIQHLRSGDEILLREWVEDMAHGGSSAHPHRHLRDADLSSVGSSIRESVRDRISGATSRPGADSTWNAQRAGAVAAARRGRSSVRSLLRGRLAGSLQPSEAAEPSVRIEVPGPVPRLHVAYSTASAWRSDWEGGLVRGGLLLPIRDFMPELGSVLELLVIPPSGAAVSCNARVEALLTTGVGVAIDGDPEELFSPEELEVTPAIEIDIPE